MESELPLIGRAQSHAERVAILADSRSFRYREIFDRSARLASVLLDGSVDLEEARIAYLIPAGYDHVCAQWAIWRAGGISVPLSLSATETELMYTLNDSAASCVVVTRDLQRRVELLCQELGLRLLIIDDLDAAERISRLPELDKRRGALILYTSGTTSEPKGVVSTHETIQAQIESLVNAWKWQPDDSIPLFLPLHHVHGIINVMSCALWAGATIEPFPRFDLDSILKRVASDSYTVFMAVPTIYVKLSQRIDAMGDDEREAVVDGFSKMRLMISGSAALPASVHKSWAILTGQQLLERYGMTEIGMALSNPCEGERRPGTVGQPLPGVEIRLKSDQGDVVTDEGMPGEIQVRGKSVFSEYWRRPQLTADSFDDGWFKTGDMAILENGYYQIMGRQSVDIIKSGGYKLSALEIESVLIDHPSIHECAVVGIPDQTWGEGVAAAIVLHGDTELDLQTLRSWSQNRLSKYKIPKHWKVVESLPRNAMGKVTKPAVTQLFAIPNAELGDDNGPTSRLA